VVGDNRLAALLRSTAAAFGDRTALVCGETQRSFAELDQRSSRLADVLARIGLQPGERVALLLHNCCEYVEFDFALIRAGLIRVPLNTRLAATEISYILRDSGTNLLVYGSDLAAIVASLATDLPSLRHRICVGGPQLAPGDLTYDSLIRDGDGSFSWQAVGDDDPYQILYTSGTTGRPKGALTTFRSRFASLSNVYASEMSVSTDDVFLLPTSMSHGGGTKILPHFLKGARTVLLPEFKVETFCALVQAERVTTTWLVPTMVQMIVDAPARLSYDLSTLHTVIYAAAPMPVEVLRRALAVFGPIFVQVYGLTEAPNPDLVLAREDHRTTTAHEELRLASAGRPALFVEVRVVNQDGHEVAPGELGEILIRGDNVMTGYWNNPDATAEAFTQDGWLHTSDIATVDEHGYVYIVDRKNEMIISGGYNIYPREVEEVLYAHPAVAECAVFGIPDPVWGESVKAVVALRPGARSSEDDLIEFCRSRLASYKKPRSVTFAEEMPKNANGKISRRELREPFWRGYARNV
jgi:acyl-CoA synthetase (AMP-forming)/AMP-acid ligase II